MQTTYRQAYASAYAMAKLAEQAYRFERNDETTTLLSEPYWTQSRSGLLAGEMLLGDLQNMERRFIETNYRIPEITQSFSMMQISPAALVNLRQNASCSFDIPELCFDLALPAISRRTDRGLPQYDDAGESDTFLLSGAEDLVPVLAAGADGQWTKTPTIRDGYIRPHQPQPVRYPVRLSSRILRRNRTGIPGLWEGRPMGHRRIRRT
jgi:hypothetical protein